MKKRLFFVLPIVFVLCLLPGCAGSPQANQDDVPAFVSYPPAAQDMIIGIGGAKQSNVQRANQMADGRARQDLAEQLSILAIGAITDYSRQTGIKDDKTVQEFLKIAERQLKQLELTGVQLVKREPAKNGVMYSLVVITQYEAFTQAAGVLEAEASRYPEFKGMDALAELEKQFEKAGTEPLVITR